MADSKRLIQLFIVAAIAVTILPLFMQLGLTSGATSLDPAVGQTYTIDSTLDDVPGIVDVSATTERAVRFNSSGYIASDAPQNLTAGDWTVCAAAELDSDANKKATYDIFAYDNATVLLQYDAGQWSVYHDNGSADAKATVAVGNATDGFEVVCGRYDDSANELQAYANGTLSSAVNLTSSTTSRNVSEMWDGRLDEIRTFESTLNKSDLDTLHVEPITPLPDRNRTGRWMLDDGSGSSTTVYFASGSATIVDGDWTSGLADPSLSRGSDYTLDGGPFTLTIPQGSFFEGAPILYVEWGTDILPFDLPALLVLFGALTIIVKFRSEIMRMMT